jgi:hypothetical protein
MSARKLKCYASTLGLLQTPRVIRTGLWCTIRTAFRVETPSFVADALATTLTFFVAFSDFTKLFFSMADLPPAHTPVSPFFMAYVGLLRGGQRKSGLPARILEEKRFHWRCRVVSSIFALRVGPESFRETTR